MRVKYLKQIAERIGMPILCDYQLGLFSVVANIVPFERRIRLGVICADKTSFHIDLVLPAIF